MRRSGKKVSLSPSKRWSRLKRRLTYLRRRSGVPGAHMNKTIASLNVVCREMSNLRPDAFAVIRFETGVTLHGLSYEVDEGIEAHGLRCTLRAAQKEGHSTHLVFEADDLEGLPNRLFPGERFDGGLGDEDFTIFFEPDKKKALAIVRKARAKRG